MGLGSTARRVALALCLAWAGSALGCTLLEPYGEGVPEICDDGVDNDLDGAADCDDSNCRTAACQEDSVARCTDGIDDDGDGRIDFADPTCWPEGVPSIERCASVLGGDRGTGFWNGSTVVVPDPDGTHGDVYSLTTFGAGTRSLASARADTVLTGALEGLEASVQVRFPAVLAGQFGIALVDATATRDLSHQLLLHIRPASGGTTTGVVARVVDGQTEMGDIAADFAPLHAWITLHFSIARGVFSVRVDEGTPLRVALPRDFPDGTALTFQVSGPDDVLLGHAQLTREAMQRCTDADAVGTTPPFGTTIPSSTGYQSSTEWLAAATELPDGSSCALVYQGRDALPALRASREQSGVWATPVTVLESSFGAGTLPSRTGGNAWGGAALALDPRAHTLTAVVAQIVGAAADPTWDYAIVRSEDQACGAWTASERLALPLVSDRATVSVPPSGLEIVDGAHQLTLLTTPLSAPADFARADLRTFRSPTGAAGSFVAVGAGDTSLLAALDPARTDHGALFDLPRIRPLGPVDHVAVVRRWDGHLELWVERTTGWRQVPGVSIEASGEDGAFDDVAISYGDLVEDEASPALWRGRILYSGLYGDGTSARQVGFGPTRVVIRAPGATP